MTNKRSFILAFAIGLLAVAWVAAGFIGSSSWLALAMTLAIGAAYGVGAWELRQFRATTAGLADALAQVPQPLGQLADWLERVPANLRHAVRLRVEGERGALPGPALTPYLVGLLVMLGMLGTFLGMVVTFKGAVFALEASTDLQAIRAALAEPIRGLGLSFGASVAGVAASAMLGLMSTLSRRERLEVARALDSRIASDLRPFSRAHQRQETLRTLQSQSAALPDVAAKLDALMARIEQRSQQLDDRLIERQSQFHRDMTQAYTELARSVGTSLQDSLVAGARAAGDSLEPVVAGAMARVADGAQRMHQRLETSAQSQVDALSQQFASQVADAQARWDRAQAAQAQDEQQRLRAWTDTLQAMAAGLQAQWQRATDQAIAQQQAVAQAVEQSALQVAERASAQAGRTLDDVSQLLARSEDLVRTRMASESRWSDEQAQRQAQLAERDNLALQERTTLLAQLGTLLQSLHQAAGEQRAAIESLVASAAGVLDQATGRFADTLQAQAGQAADAAAQVGASAVELASLAESFSHGVQLFQAGSDKLVDSLQRIESSINKSTARSDEQLAYYVAQAREVIDLSITSQQGLLEHLRLLQSRPAEASPVMALADGDQ